jgi:DNA helicase-2/ATP-dependent DNA helicase PcrA
VNTFDERYPGVEQIPLEENFRSSEGVVETARAFVEQNSTRLMKAMKPTGAQPYESGVFVALRLPRHVHCGPRGMRHVTTPTDSP